MCTSHYLSHHTCITVLKLDDLALNSPSVSILSYCIHENNSPLSMLQNDIFLSSAVSSSSSHPIAGNSYTSKED